jgi:hypothetical protein
MRRVFALAFFPLVLFALETFNLIKDHSFEKNSELWKVYAGGDGDQDSAVASRHDSENTHSGSYSASSDTRPIPGDYWIGYDDTALVIQGFCCPKVVADLDSLIFYYSLIPLNNNFQLSYGGFIALYINAGDPDYRLAGYILKAKDLEAISFPPRIYLKTTDYTYDTSWHRLAENIREDLGEIGISSDARVDSTFLMGWGVSYPPWRGQKFFWDDVRLTGYADYDVGVKEILSSDSIGASGDSLYRSSPDPTYQPVARIKNFGREPADTFLAIAEIRNEYGLIYADTVPWSMEGDTEDTITFRHYMFEFPMSATYTLTIRTVADPDECDEDNELSKLLIYEAITEPVTHLDAITLQVRFLASPLRVSYLLPHGEHGTLTLYDAAGRRVERVNVQGSGKVNFSSALPSGVYSVKLEAGDLTLTRKAVVLR